MMSVEILFIFPALLQFHSASVSPSVSPTSSALSSKRNWLTSDLITSSVSSCTPPVSQPSVNFPIISEVLPFSDLQNVLSAASIPRSLDGNRSSTNSGSSTLLTASSKPASPNLCKSTRKSLNPHAFAHIK